MFMLWPPCSLPSSLLYSRSCIPHPRANSELRELASCQTCSSLQASFNGREFGDLFASCRMCRRASKVGVTSSWFNFLHPQAHLASLYLVLMSSWPRRWPKIGWCGHAGRGAPPPRRSLVDKVISRPIGSTGATTWTTMRFYSSSSISFLLSVLNMFQNSITHYKGHLIDDLVSHCTAL